METRRNYTRQKKAYAPKVSEQGKLQPQDKELEEAVLGALMLEKDAYTTVCDILKPECFYEPTNQLIYSAISRLGAQQRPIDMLTVTEQLRLDGKLDEVGGALRISELLNIVTRDIIEKDREKSKAVISITMVNAASGCAKFVASTIITNNVDNNRDQIEYNARHLVNSVYYDAYSKLNMYRGDEDYLSHYMKEEWKEDIYGDIINIVYNKNLDSNQRILAFNKRIDIRVNDYTAYIINKAFK